MYKQKLDFKNLLTIKSWKEKEFCPWGFNIRSICRMWSSWDECRSLCSSRKELQTRNFNGGAAIVASHVKALGANCEFLSIVGDDENGEITKTKLNKEGVQVI